MNNKNPPLIKSRNVTSLNWAHQQNMAQAGTANSNPSHIQLVYDSSQSDHEAANKPEANVSET